MMSVSAPAFTPNANASEFVPGDVRPTEAAAHGQAAQPPPAAKNKGSRKGGDAKQRETVGDRRKGGSNSGGNRGGGGRGRGGGGRGGGGRSGARKASSSAPDGQHKKKAPPKSHTSPPLGGGSVSPQVSPSLFAAPVSPGAQGRKGTNANHLLNFQLVERNHGPADARPVHLRPKHSRPRKLKKLGFLHSSSDVRFGVAPGDYGHQSADGDRPLPWDCVQIVFLNSQDPNYRCPVCLEPPCCPKITQCGHVFCWTCLLQYLSYASEPGRKCPMCNDFINGDDLRTVHVNQVKPVKAGSTVDVVLMQRGFSTVFPQQFDSSSATGGLSVTMRVPTVSDPVAKFAKFSIVDSMGPIYAKEREQLQAGQRIAVAESEHSMPFFEGALVQLECAERMASARALPRPTGLPTAPARATPVVALEKPSSDDDGAVAQSMWSSDDEEQPRELEPARPAWGPNPSHDAPPGPKPTLAKPKQTSSMKSAEAPGLPHAAVDGAIGSTSDDIFYFYQSLDGQPVFLHPLEMRCLQDHAGGVGGMDSTMVLSVSACENYIQDESTHKRFKFLRHLPEGSAFAIVEVNVKSMVSAETWSRFSGMFKQRDDKRRKLKKEQQRKDSQYSKKAQAAQQAADEQAPAYLSQVYTRRDESIFEDDFFKAASADEIDAALVAAVAESHDAPGKSYSNITRNMGYFPELSEQFPSLDGGAGSATSAAPTHTPLVPAAGDARNTGKQHVTSSAGAWGAGSSAKRADGVYSIADAPTAQEGGEEKVAPTLKQAWAEALLGKESDPIPTPQGGKGRKNKKGKQLLFATGQYR